jgi:hypothetical protein
MMKSKVTLQIRFLIKMYESYFNFLYNTKIELITKIIIKNSNLKDVT